MVRVMPVGCPSCGHDLFVLERHEQEDTGYVIRIFCNSCGEEERRQEVSSDPDVVSAACGARGEVRRGRPMIGGERMTFEATKPWLVLGMARRTWYRRRQLYRLRGEGSDG
jgi:hypothetical protein